jgi:hypothetical protein
LKVFGVKLILKKISNYITRSNIDFLFILNRPEFRDFVDPIYDALQRNGFQCLILEPQETKALRQTSKLDSPAVVITTNEYAEIASFSQSKKVLLPHAIFLRDSTPTPLSLGNEHFLDFDFYFASNIFWFEWIQKSLIDFAYYPPSQIRSKSEKFIVLGGYVKRLSSISSSREAATEGSPLILYAPNVYSPELPHHRFHLDGSQILMNLAKSFPQANIVCRPHPTDANRDQTKDVIKSLVEYKNVSFDLSLTPNPDLYSRPDILITDLSTFALAHELMTNLRPIFIFNKLSPDLNRFTQLASRFADIATNTDELVTLVKRKLDQTDTLKPSEKMIFKELFLSEINNLNQVVKDLVHIRNAKKSENWMKVPFLFE